MRSDWKGSLFSFPTLFISNRNEAGAGVIFWLILIGLVVVLLSFPYYLSRFQLLNLSLFLLMGFLAAGLSFLWGYGGILSLGQSAFFGLGAYAFGIAGINLAAAGISTNWAIPIGLIVPVVAAVTIGYTLFFARVQGVYIAILMLVITLLFETFLNQTAGPQWQVGVAQLGGNNGLGRFSGDIQPLPSIVLGAEGDVVKLNGRTREFYWLVVGLLVACYIALRVLANSRYGTLLIAIREDQDRTETLGYDVRLLQLMAFMLAGFLAGVSGVLYVSWGNFVTPSVFGANANILPIIWVALAGRKSIIASIIGAVVLQWLSQFLATKGEFALVVQGLLLTGIVMARPDGIASLFVRRKPGSA